MTDIKLPPMPQAIENRLSDFAVACAFGQHEQRASAARELRQAINEYAREAVRLNAQAVPDGMSDYELSELAHSAIQEANSFGIGHDLFLRYFKTLRKRLNAQAVPEGWQLVPKKPTIEMLHAALDYHGSPRYQDEPLSDDVSDAECYAAMLASAPPAPAAPPQPAPTPRKMEIPTPPADALDVAFAEGWNQCCDAYFGGLPPQAPLVVTVFKTNSDTEAPQPAQQPLTDEQCDAIYMALDNWAREFDQHEFGLPHSCGGGVEGGREIIRQAHGIGVKND